MQEPEISGKNPIYKVIHDIVVGGVAVGPRFEAPHVRSLGALDLEVMAADGVGQNDLGLARLRIK
jgi:hypothetical protein